MSYYSRTFYPELDPYRTLQLPVSNLHTLYVEECGNPNGKPVIVLHGGPGGGINPKHRRYFDPRAYRIILFDQRGCGKSTPFASIEENKTQDHINDIEKIRLSLGIDRWMVVGGSWGSCLALRYALAHPERVSEMILRGLFTGTQRETDWLYRFGASEVFFSQWSEFQQWIPEEERQDLILAYFTRLNHKDPAVCLEAARRWLSWEAAIISLYPDQTVLEINDNVLAFARLENYYARYLYFNDNDVIWRKIDHLAQIPTVIVHGRYDMVCNARTAIELHQKLKNSKLVIVPDAGHSGSEPGILHHIIEASDQFRDGPLK